MVYWCLPNANSVLTDVIGLDYLELLKITPGHQQQEEECYPHK